MAALDIEAGTVSDYEAKEEFLQFVDAFNDFTSDSPDDFPAIGYRMDTWQIWAKCTEHVRSNTAFACRNPGLHVTIDAPNVEPFVGMYGPYQLFRERSIDVAFDRVANEVAYNVQVAAGHMHIYGQPHHFHCELCRVGT